MNELLRMEFAADIARTRALQSLSRDPKPLAIVHYYVLVDQPGSGASRIFGFSGQRHPKKESVVLTAMSHRFQIFFQQRHGTGMR